jgi:RimJ/RimL family protein N-acetyltransferase
MSHLPVLKSYRVQLRPVVAADAPTVQEYCSNRALAEQTRRVPHPYPEGEAERWIAQHPRLWESRKEMVYGIAHREHDELYGVISLSLDLKNLRGEYGFWVGEPHWNEGYCTEAAGLMKRVAFEQLKLNRIYGKHFASNPASGRVFEKIGMQREGLLRGHVVRDRESRDIVIWGMTRGDYDKV